MFIIMPRSKKSQSTTAASSPELSDADRTSSRYTRWQQACREHNRGRSHFNPVGLFGVPGAPQRPSNWGDDLFTESVFLACQKTGVPPEVFTVVLMRFFWYFFKQITNCRVGSIPCVGVFYAAARRGSGGFFRFRPHAALHELHRANDRRVVREIDDIRGAHYTRVMLQRAGRTGRNQTEPGVSFRRFINRLLQHTPAYRNSLMGATWPFQPPARMKEKAKN
jgi:hypothetical protein